MRDPNNPCIFCIIRNEELLFENKLAYASLDSYPVSKFQILIVPKRHLENYFQLSPEEINACNELIFKTKENILKKDSTVKGFNLGTNAGKVAGQSIMHCHIHLIPRREGDVEKLIAETSKILTHIEWEPKYNNLEDIINSSIKWEEKINAANT